MQLEYYINLIYFYKLVYSVKGYSMKVKTYLIKRLHFILNFRNSNYSLIKIIYPEIPFLSEKP